jgi:hypothetical protein
MRLRIRDGKIRIRDSGLTLRIRNTASDLIPWNLFGCLAVLTQHYPRFAGSADNGEHARVAGSRTVAFCPGSTTCLQVCKQRYIQRSVKQSNHLF